MLNAGKFHLRFGDFPESVSPEIESRSSRGRKKTILGVNKAVTKMETADKATHRNFERAVSSERQLKARIVVMTRMDKIAISSIKGFCAGPRILVTFRQDTGSQLPTKWSILAADNQ